MPHHVYANDLEICSKSSDGKSAEPPSDVCLSPPQNAPVPIAYPNVAFAKHLANGTSTVFIKRKEVAKRDISYIATSTGNEPATETTPKAVASHVIKGKAYFVDWSDNVKAEGANVCRHEDLMTHNHN